MVCNEEGMDSRATRLIAATIALDTLTACTVGCGDETEAVQGTHESAGHSGAGHEEVGHEGSSSGSHTHNHGGSVDLSGLAQPPSVALTATSEGPGVVDLEIAVDGLELVPVNPPRQHHVGQGHVHITVDGASVAMISDPRYRLTGLSSGSHVIAAALSSNDHRDYVVNGKPVAAEVTLTVEVGAGMVVDHRFDVDLVGGEVVGGPPRLKVAVGDLVEVAIHSDTIEEVHLHIYDMSVAVHPGSRAILRLAATIPGVFEAELHGSGLRVFELQVS